MYPVKAQIGYHLLQKKKFLFANFGLLTLINYKIVSSLQSVEREENFIKPSDFFL